MSNVDKKELVKLISYMSTFDGGLYITKGKNNPNNNTNAKFIMNMRKENLDYINWVAETLSNLTAVSIKDRPDYNTDGYTRQPQVRLESKRHPFLTKIRNRIYTPNGKKVIDPRMLKLMDAEALAIIFMADGGTHLDTRFKNLHGNISLNTKGFSEADNLALSKAIYEKLGIRSKINKHNQYRYLRIKTVDNQLFIDTIKKYVLPSFWYKLERLAPVYKLDGDTVCSSVEAEESGGNDQILSKNLE